MVPWRDIVPIDFDLGFVGQHLYLAFRQLAARGKSIVMLYDCVDTDPVVSCFVDTQGNNLNWRVSTFNAPPVFDDGGQYQPNVTATQDSDGVAIDWYQRKSSSDAAMTTLGAFSSDGANSWSSVYELRNAASVPCPSAGAGADGLHYYGDYVGSVILPFTHTVADISLVPSGPWIVTAHADSSAGCLNAGEITYDQHVQSVVW